MGGFRGLMPYPATITNSYGMDMGFAGMGDFHFEYSGNHYCCLLDAFNSGGPFKLHMFKSTDQGQSWTELDSSNAPNIVTGSVGGVPFPYTLAVDGSTVQLLWTRMHTSGATAILDGLRQCTFDLTGSGAWGTPANISSGGIGSASSNGRKVVFQIIVRGAGDYIVLHSGTRASGFARTSYSTYDGSSLGSAVSIPSQSAGVHYMPVGAAYDAVSGVTLFEYRQGGQSGSTGHVWTVGLDASNTFGTPVEVVSSAVWDWEFQSPPIAYDNGGTIYFAFATTRLTGGNVVIDFQQAPAELDPTYDSPVNIFTGNAASNQRVPTLTNLVSGGDAKSMALGADTTQIQACWPNWMFDDGDQPWVYSGSNSAIGSGTWSSAATLFQPDGVPFSDQSPTCQIHASGGAGGIGIIGVSFDDTSANNTEQPQFYLVGGAAPAPLRNTFE
jgi:hypothetical protein